MSIPVNALTEEELVHYAGIEPGVAEELARRVSLGLADLPTLEAELEPIRQDLQNAEGECDELDRQLENLRDDAKTAINRIREILEGDDPVEKKHEAIFMRLKKLEEDL